MEQWILLAMAPVFLGLVLLEAWYWRRRRPVYSLVDTASNASLALMHQGADALAWLLIIGVFVLVHQHRLFDLPTNVWTIAPCSSRRTSSITGSTARTTASAGCGPRAWCITRPNA